MNEEDFAEKYARAEMDRQYLLFKVEELENNIRELQKKIHEAAHNLDSSFQEREYWQNIAARQQ